MSEDTEMGTSHLCTTEDAFEQFQSVSMYEEDEYITLADIVPPQPSVPNYGDLSPIPYDNEVVLTTSDEPEEAVIKDTTGEIEQTLQQDSNITHLVSSDSKDAGLSFDNNIKPQQPKRRGRKKKSEYAVENSSDNQNIMIEKSPNTHNNGLSAGTRLVRRGRPPKTPAKPDISTGSLETTPTGLLETTPTETVSETSLPSMMDHETPTQAGKKRGRPPVKRVGRPKSTKVSNNQLLSAADSTTLLSSEKSGSENDRVDDNMFTKTTQRKRRERKVSTELIDNQTQPSLSENNASLNDHADQAMSLPIKKSHVKRSKRNKVEGQEEIQEVEQSHSDIMLKSADNKITNDPSTLENDELDEISLSQLKHVADNSTLLSPTKGTAENSLNSMPQNYVNAFSEFVSKLPKRGGKRGKGRRKKNVKTSPQPSANLETSTEKTVNETKQEEDETDDLCLSQLKETIELTTGPTIESTVEPTMDSTVKPTMDSTVEPTMDSTVEPTIEPTDAPTIEDNAIVDDAKLNINDDNGTLRKRSTKMPLMSDFEYNIDGITNDTNETAINDPDQSLLVEDSSKRPVRRRVKQTLHYDQESDEDPFANLPSSSDDEPRKGRNRKGNRYHSDEEYYPGNKRGKSTTDTESDSEIYENIDESKKQKKKIWRKKSETQSPQKRGKKTETNTAPKDDDIEEVLQSSVITAGDEHAQPLNAWGTSNEFENFLAKKIQGTDLKIKKVSSTEPSDKSITPLEIPVIDPEEKKTIEMCTQTTVVSTESTSVQTTAPFDIAMKENVALTKEQSEKACQFLNSIVQTTAELGQLMTQKSEDFIKKKIHTKHVTDTGKMDYCVRKSFLLFKLAKHNLMQMEEDLAKQYEDFLQSNNLSFCRERQKELSGKSKPVKDNSDSDCEIVEEIKPTQSNKKQNLTKFNPKTVFLNKELSIKIAKKTSEPQKPQKKIEIKGRHTVWISDTVMVKKVKPTQSFLAQDSRNKKPPDTFVTTKMISDFFTDFHRQKALTVCAPFITTEWHNMSRECVCNYFVVKPVDLNAGANISTNEGNNLTNAASIVSVPDVNHLNGIKPIVDKFSHPEPLFKLCFRLLQNHLHVLNRIKKVDDHHSTSIKLTDGRVQPVELIKLCLTVLTDHLDNDEDLKLTSTKSMLVCSAPICTATVPSLKTLCYRRVVELGFNSNSTYQEIQAEETKSIKCTSIVKKSSLTLAPSNNKNGIKPLFSLCVELIQKQQNCYNDDRTQLLTPNTLKHIAFENIKFLLYRDLKIRSKYSKLSPCRIGHEVPIEGLTINSVNTLSEEAFLNLEQPIDIPQSSNYDNDFENDDSSVYDDTNFEPDFNNPEENISEETNWVSQVQMQELTSFPFNTCEDVGLNNEPTVTQIKLEPIDEAFESIADPPVVKPEPCVGLDEMTIIPDIDPIKPEITEDRNPRSIQRQDSSSYDVCTFESFVQSSKLMNSDEYNNEDIFSQSASRVRRQHEPDLDEDNDMGMSLLVPQTYEPINIETAKGSLMESSSDESSQNRKAIGKKKTEKRARGRPRKINKIVPPPTAKDKVTNNVVAILTRRMRDKIRQEEKKDESTDSENETLSRVLRNKKDNNEKSKTTPCENVVDTEIQCSNVDSTENATEDISEQFTGFTAIDQNETSSYQKFMKYVYDKIVPNFDEVEQETVTDVPTDNTIADVNINLNSDSLFESNEAIELLECEPTLPIFGEVEIKTRRKDKEKKAKEVTATDTFTKEKTKPVSAADSFTEENNKPVTATDSFIEEKKTKPVTATDSYTEENKTKPVTAADNFIERHGWKCYPVNNNDSKLYQTTSISLEKLPENFVETYFRYQDITNKNKDDEEVDRLTNLTTLKRNSNLKESKISGKSKRDKGDRTSEQNSELGSRPASPANYDRYDELTPSEDEGRDAAEDMPALAPKQTDNTLAKDALMNDNDSDSDAGNKIKQEPTDEPNRNTRASKHKSRVSPNKVENADPDSLMLTADKVMNKELSLLHAPVVLDGEVKDAASIKAITRSKQKSATKNQSMKGHRKSDDDSSSEEEKQWVNTKEKLLKRLGKKEDTSVDDAKRAKLVSEFIERRADYPDSHKRTRGRGGRSRKKFLERQKQLKVLSRELFGETSIDPGHNKRSAQAYFKGRRNIRKVIDKKSLARSTVMANMEEFERKRRLNSRQTRLRELVGCEEGVNVLVINDEVCLEYDFEECRPVVTIHPFFTKVMKAHQYEGVKFMWDACFESLPVVESGHAGGGCILAHCMGLGKTLQVLALLHTVLTHPRVGMRRVLVCCPLSTVLNWVDEIHKWLGPVTNAIKVFELSKLKKTYERAYQLEDWYNGGGIFIIGYELFRSLSTIDPFLDDVRPTIANKIRSALLDPGPDIIVCDEGHLLKNDCSVLAVAMSRVVTKRRIVLTGTPMQNNLREYYCMVDFVKPNLLGTYAEYSNRFENPIMNGQHRDSREEDIRLMKARTHILHKVLEGCLQRQEASVLYPYLPKKHEYTVFIPLTPCQWDMYKHYLTYYSRQGKHGILKDFHILHKIWSHPQVLHNFQTKAAVERIRKDEKLEDDLAAEDLVEDIKPKETELWWLPYVEEGKVLDSLEASNKFMVVFQILEECVALGDKMLLFSTSLFCLDGLEYFLKKINKWSLGQEYYRLDGSVPAEVRQKWCREFNADNNEKTKLFLVSTRAGCLGLNMTAANRVVILDTSWNPAHDIQSIFRVYRFGQKKDCYIYRLVAMGTMEQKIYERSVTKQAVACRVVDEQQIDRHYNSADLTELYGYDELGSSVACGVAVGVHDVVLLRVAHAVPLHAVHEHDSLLRGSEPALPEHERAEAWHQFQQEQEDKQFQNKLIAIPKIPLKRIHGHEYAKVPVTPQSIKVEDTSDDYVPPGPKSRKGKKVVKCCIPVNNDSSPFVPNILRGSNMRRGIAQYTRSSSRAGTPIEILDTDKDFQQAGPSRGIPSVQIIGSKTVPNEDDIEEEVMVQKISDILLKHNFQDRKMEIGTLITQVRRLVSKDKFKKSEMPDELSRSIAEVLLGEGCDSAPSVTNIMCESLSTIVQRPPVEVITGDLPEKPKPKSKKAKVGNHVIDLNLAKTKRKAAIAAEKTIDNIAQDVINLDDDDFDGDGEYLPDIPCEEEIEQNDAPTITPITETDNCIIETNKDSESKSPVYEKPTDNAPVTEVKKYKAVKKTNDKTKKTNEKKKEIIEPNSIVLSDDEERPVPQASKGPEVEEIVPLPHSLLTNKNFIKIVAHTYSAGNPMLDNDAATLAAQYSTFRALKESEETGKDIVSGPIYDIAMNVLGKLTLKRLLTVNDNVKKSAEDTAALQFKQNLQAFENVSSDTSTAKEPTTPTEPPAMTVQSRTEVPNVMNNVQPQTPFPCPASQIKSRYTTDGRKIVKLVESRTKPMMTPAEMVNSAAPVATNVVPVGLIKRGAPSQSYGQPYAQPTAPARDECILPDDDVRIVPDNPPPLTPAPTVKQPIATFTRTSALNSNPVILNHILNAPRKNLYFPQNSVTEPSQIQKPVIQIAMGKVVMPDAFAPTNPGQGNDTICLDSDEEETITPQIVHRGPVKASPQGPAPAATPVSLTAAKLPLPPLHKLKPTSKPMVLQNKLPQGSAQRKFVLVPASQVPPEILKTVPETAHYSNARSQSVPQTTASFNARAAPKDAAAPTAASNLRVSKTKCKPGDVFRISKTGQIEVFGKDAEDGAGMSTGAATTKEPPAAVQKPVRTPSVTPQKAAESRKTTVSTSSSNSSRSSSPENPLSILKDVVHIQAADDAPKNTASVPKTVVTKTEINKNTSLQHVVSMYSKNIKTNAATSKSTVESAAKVTKVGGDKKRAVLQIERTKPTSEAVKPRDKNDVKAASSGASNKFNSPVAGGSGAAKSKSYTKMPEKGTPTKVVGNLKNIVLEGSGKGVTVNTKKKLDSIDLTGQNSVQVTNIKKIPAAPNKLEAKIKPEAKKRPAAEANASAANKKRKPMTLKDFDLDDLDDIIELD